VQQHNGWHHLQQPKQHEAFYLTKTTQAQTEKKYLEMATSILQMMYFAVSI